MDDKLLEILETIHISFEKQKIFVESGLFPVKVFKIKYKSLQKEKNIKGVLIYGPSGVGKSTLIKRIRQELGDIHFLILDCSAFLSKVYLLKY